MAGPITSSRRLNNRRSSDLITGFCGKSHLVVMIIRIGSEFHAPHPHHTQQLDPNGPKVYLAQSPSGLVDVRLKLAFSELQLECPEVPIGNKPSAGTADGHNSNTNNLEMSRLFVSNKVSAQDKT